MATKIKLNDCVPCIAIHPGEIIKDELDAREMKQKELASLMSMPTSVLNDIIKGRRAVTPEVAVLLQEILGIDASYWLSLQNQYDIDQANINNPFAVFLTLSYTECQILIKFFHQAVVDVA